MGVWIYKKGRALGVEVCIREGFPEKVTLEPSQKITNTKVQDKRTIQNTNTKYNTNTKTSIYWFFWGEWGMRRPDQAHVPILCRGVIGDEPTWGA